MNEAHEQTHSDKRVRFLIRIGPSGLAELQANVDSFVWSMKLGIDDLHTQLPIALKHLRRLLAPEDAPETVDVAALAESLLRRLLPVISSRRGREPLLPMAPDDDAFVDQNCGLVNKALFLRLCRRKAFPVKEVGKLRVVRWGDVKTALAARQIPVVQVAAPPVDDEQGLLNDIRSRCGLATKAA